MISAGADPSPFGAAGPINSTVRSPPSRLGREMATLIWRWFWLRTPWRLFFPTRSSCNTYRVVSQHVFIYLLCNKKYIYIYIIYLYCVSPPIAIGIKKEKKKKGKNVFSNSIQYGMHDLADWRMMGVVRA